MSAAVATLKRAMAGPSVLTRSAINSTITAAFAPSPTMAPAHELEASRLSHLSQHLLREFLDRFRGVALSPKLDANQRRAFEHVQLFVLIAVAVGKVTESCKPLA